MENEKEVSPLSSGTEEVSSNTEDGGVEAPATVALQETTAVTVLCKQCSAPTPRLGMNTKYCPTCSAGRHKITDKNRADRKKASSFVYDSGVEPTKAEAKALLEERGLKHPHVIDTVYKLLTRAAEEHQITPNRFLYAHGLKAALASYEIKAPRPLEAIAAEYVPAELLTK